jgi:hypothetical protein
MNGPMKYVDLSLPNTICCPKSRARLTNQLIFSTSNMVSAKLAELILAEFRKNKVDNLEMKLANANVAISCWSDLRGLCRWSTRENDKIPYLMDGPVYDAWISGVLAKFNGAFRITVEQAEKIMDADLEYFTTNVEFRERNFEMIPTDTYAGQMGINTFQQYVMSSQQTPYCTHQVAIATNQQGEGGIEQANIAPREPEIENGEDSGLGQDNEATPLAQTSQKKNYAWLH